MADEGREEGGVEKGEACEQASIEQDEFDEKLEVLVKGELPECLTNFPNGIELEGEGLLLT